MIYNDEASITLDNSMREGCLLVELREVTKDSSRMYMTIKQLKQVRNHLDEMIKQNEVQNNGNPPK